MYTLVWDCMAWRSAPELSLRLAVCHVLPGVSKKACWIVCCPSAAELDNRLLPDPTQQHSTAAQPISPAGCSNAPGRRLPACRHERLPGLPSSKLGLEAMTGALEDFGFESYLGLPQDSETPQPDLHSQMEQRLGLASGTKPMARGLPM